MTRIAACSLILGTILTTAPPAVATTITGNITADNHYAVYTGDVNGAHMAFWGRNELGRGGNPGRYNWSLPETYDIETDAPYLFLAAWSDDRVAQGVLADLRIDGLPLLSGDPRWEVFPTGRDLDDGDPAPCVAEIARQVRAAQRRGWRPIAVGPANGGRPWRTIPAISPDAHWMWAQAGNVDPFGPQGDAGEYLIFRTPIPEPAAAILLLGGLGAFSRRR